MSRRQFLFSNLGKNRGKSSQFARPGKTNGPMPTGDRPVNIEPSISTRCLTLVPTRNSRVYGWESNRKIKPASIRRGEIKHKTLPSSRGNAQRQKIFRINPGTTNTFSQMQCKIPCIAPKLNGQMKNDKWEISPVPTLVEQDQSDGAQLQNRER